MKLNSLFNLMVLGSALTITGFGCKTHPQKPINIPGTRPPIGPGGFDTGTAVPFNNNNNVGADNNAVKTSDGRAPNSGADHQGWKEDGGSTLHADIVYFDFDKSAIKSSEQSKLNEVGNYLKSNPNAAVRVEGNCDSRGTEEYNRSLGERRALAAREYLIQLGIDAGRVDTLSNGQDKPAEQGKGEEVYAKNRRDEFIVLTPP